MKKLLSLLSTVAITATAASTVVSCSVPKTDIKVNFGPIDGGDGTGFTYNLADNTYTIKNGNLDGTKDVKYTAAELDAAMNGNYAMMNQQIPVAMSFDQLNQALLSMISFNQTLVVKTQKNMQQLRDFRDTFLGRDQDSVNEKNGGNTPSVDGIKFNSVDDSNYYAQFDKTFISSLTGLKNLHDYANNSNSDVKALGSAAKSELDMANTLFGDSNSAANKLMKDFSNSKKNPAFTNISYDAPLVTYNSQSQFIQGFADNTEPSDNGPLTLGDVQGYYDNNTNVTLEKEVKTGKKSESTNVTDKITDHANSNKFAAIVINPSGVTDSKDFKFAGPSSKQLTEMKGDKDKMLSEFFTDKEDADIKYFVTQDGDNKSSFNENLGQYLVKKVGPIKVTYKYQTDVEHSKSAPKKDSKEFTISTELNNLTEIYSPYIIPVEATSLVSATPDDKGNVTLDFGTKLTQDNKQTMYDQLNDLTINGAAPANPSIDKDGKLVVQANKANEIDISFKPVSTTKDEKDSTKYDVRTSKEALNYKFTIGDKKVVNFTTSQLVWVFRGYKFLDFDNLNESEKTTKFVDAEKVKGKATGLATRDDALKADILHNLRDIKTSDWSIAEKE